ncbi:hypothetical protein Tco_0675135 [Tanacetum coccineum]
MGDEHLSTIPKTESDELIKSSDENLVQIPSESEDFSDIKSECDVPDCDDSQTKKISTFSNPLFDDSTSSDDESSHEEVIHEISFKTYSNPLFDLDEEIISILISLESLLNRDTLMALSKMNSSREFAGELINNSLQELLIREAPRGIYSLLERLLYDNSSPCPLEDFHGHPNTIIESLPTFPIPVEDSNSLREEIDIFPIETRLHPGICIEVESMRFLAPLSPVIDTLLPFSSENEDKVFNHGVLASKEKSPPSLSHRVFKASKIFHHKSPMIALDFEASRARCFCPSFTRASILCFIMGIQYLILSTNVYLLCADAVNEGGQGEIGSQLGPLLSGSGSGREPQVASLNDSVLDDPLRSKGSRGSVKGAAQLAVMDVGIY